MDTTSLNKIIEVGNDYIHIQTGVNTDEILDILSEKNLSLGVVHPFEIHTIGGLISKNFNSFDSKYSSFNETIIFLKFISKEGSLCEIDDPEEILKIENFGLIVEVKLKVQKNEILQKKQKKIKIEDLKNLKIDNLNFCRLINDQLVQLVYFEKCENQEIEISKGNNLIEELWMDNEEYVLRNQLLRMTSILPSVDHEFPTTIQNIK